MQIHHDKHHATYVTNLNAALEKHPDFQAGDDIDALSPHRRGAGDIRNAVRNNGGGHANHSLFWQVMGPNGGGQPSGALADAITQAFGGYDQLKTRMVDAGKGRFGSGWSWLVVGRPGQAAGGRHAEPGLAADGRPHADPGRGRVGARLLPQVPEPPPDYLDAWFNTINWKRSRGGSRKPADNGITQRHRGTETTSSLCLCVSV
jgi:Fe-Mn family superoxide dismutase